MNDTDRHGGIWVGGAIRSQLLLGTALLTALFSLAGCATISESSKDSDSAPASQYFERSATFFRKGNYEAAYNENQNVLAKGTGAPDVALFNMGLISAYSLNPKKDYPKALLSFRSLAAQYPGSPLAEQAKVWIQVLEEHQKMVEERQQLVEEKRALTRERAMLSQEREKLKNAAQRSRQVDMEIEKRRRESLNR